MREQMLGTRSGAGGIFGQQYHGSVTESAPEPKKVGQVECAISELDSAIGGLERDIERLMGRLSPILRPLPPQNEAATQGAPTPIANSPLAERIFNYATTVRRLDKAIDTLTALIEL